MRRTRRNPSSNADIATVLSREFPKHRLHNFFATREGNKDLVVVYLDKPINDLTAKNMAALAALDGFMTLRNYEADRKDPAVAELIFDATKVAANPLRRTRTSRY